MLWVKRARQEHDAFADSLAERGVEVLYLHELLAETVAMAEARSEVLDRTLDAAALGPSLGPALREWLAVVPQGEPIAAQTRTSRIQAALRRGSTLEPAVNH